MLLFMQCYLPIIIYLLLIFLLIVCIILGIRLINFIDRATGVLDNVEDKVNSLNGLFNAVDFTTSKIEGFTDRLFDFGSIISSKLLKKNKKKKDMEDDEL